MGKWDLASTLIIPKKEALAYWSGVVLISSSRLLLVGL